MVSSLTLTPLSIYNGIVHTLIWNIPYRSVGVKGFTIVSRLMTCLLKHMYNFIYIYVIIFIKITKVS